MRLHLAGVTTVANMKESDNILFALESFYGLRGKSEKDLTIQRIKKRTWQCFLLDSGAFSFMAQQKKGNFKEIDWDKYLDEYIDFINRYNVRYFFELDVDSLVGYEKVKQMRTRLERETRKKCIPVWHKSRGLEEWIKMCKEYDYIAIGASGKNDSAWTIKNTSVLKKLLSIAQENNCKVHGLGFTRTKVLHEFSFYSVDSTAWLSGGRFGSLYEFNGKTMNSVSFKNRRARNAKEINNHNLKEWIKYQKYLDEGDN